MNPAPTIESNQVGAFLGALDEKEHVMVLKMMELQRHAMLMYTSCGWFFNELSGIETVQVIQYAGRALQLAQEALGSTAAHRFLEGLEKAKSNIPDYQDGRVIYEKLVKPAMLDLQRVCAHYAVSSLFEEYEKAARIFCYKVDREEYQVAGWESENGRGAGEIDFRDRPGIGFSRFQRPALR